MGESQRRGGQEQHRYDTNTMKAFAEFFGDTVVREQTEGLASGVKHTYHILRVFIR